MTESPPSEGHEQQGGNVILGNLAAGKKTDLVTLFKGKNPGELSPLEYIFILSPLPSRNAALRLRAADLTAIQTHTLTDSQKLTFTKAGLLTPEGMATQKLLDETFSQATPHTKKMFREHVLLIRFVDANKEGWHQALVNEQGLPSYRKAASLCKAGWFSPGGALSTKAYALLKEQDENDFQYLARRFTSQHASLLSLLSVHGTALDESLYKTLARSNIPWDKQLRAIHWMREKNILDEDWRPTKLATEMRLLRTPVLKTSELKELDVKLEEYLRGGRKADDFSRLKLDKLPASVIESRIFRLRASGFVDDNLRPNADFSLRSDDLRILYQSNKDPPWLRENRVPRLFDLTDSQRYVLLTLATESPYLSRNQLRHHFEIPQHEIDVLVRGELLRVRTEPIGREPVQALALNVRKAKALLKEAGIEKPLSGKFQRGSHMRHDFMLWESLQEFRKVMEKKQDRVIGILHERAIYQTKTSANDNKGISTPDLVVTTESGAEYAFEYGNYKTKEMIRKINNFPQKNVVVFSSDARRLDQYIAHFEQQTRTQTIQKHVTWYFIPEIQL